MAVSEIRICVATADDAGLLLQLIRELAAYEREPNAVVATEEDLRRYGFGPSGSSRRCWPFSTTSPAVLPYSIPGSRRGLADLGCISKICLSPKRRAERGSAAG